MGREPVAETAEGSQSTVEKKNARLSVKKVGR